ncbi:MAG: outer membrane receptor protein involved in Fe transport [Flavobacteriaceae bacterium]|jgi:outer membrane receptor protein involved in Fe transport
MKYYSLLFTLFSTVVLSAQKNPETSKIIQVSGIVLDKDNGIPLEYATLILQSVENPSQVTGGITDKNGRFNVEAKIGNYNIRIEYISYKTYTLSNKNLIDNTDLGTISIAMDVAQLNEVELIAERTTVELRLDKKVYNVGQDLTVKGGSVTDVLDNVPSVSVDVEGNISLRGNGSVRILINGKPSALSGLSPEALQQLPADAIEKVEVITNPSARYDAEGTAGILNIILKQNKTLGLNGAINATVGTPKNNAGTVNLNLRRDKFNLFTTTTFRNNEGPGNGFNKQENFNNEGETVSFQEEKRSYLRNNNDFNANIGLEYFINDNSSITNSFVVRRSSGGTDVDVDFVNFNEKRVKTLARERISNEIEMDNNFQYSINYQKKFKKDGHTLTADYQYSTGDEMEDTFIYETILGENISLPNERTLTDENQKNQLIQADYILPLGKDNQTQFELGYRGTFNRFNTTFNFSTQNTEGDYISDPNFSNTLEYKEYVNAAYTQLGTKWDAFSLLGGLRMEHSNIDVNLLETNELKNKTYTNWFPSVFLGYEFAENDQITLSFSRRLRRPRNWYINPFVSRSSNTNLRQGNPDLDPTFTNAFDLGYITRSDQFTFTTSGYYNKSTGVFEFIRQETGDFVSISNPNDINNPVTVPIILSKPVNLATEERIGMEFTTTYTPKRNWRFTWNVNLFQRALRGDYSFVNSNGEDVTQVFDADNFSWFSRLSAKVVLPYAIDFQSNIFYMGPSLDAQSRNKGMLNTSVAFSREILKDKGTISLNVSDLFNSRKRMSETRTPNVFSDSEFQWRERQINLTLVYRFNQKKNSAKKDSQGDQGGDMDF